VAVAATFCQVWGTAAALVAELDVLAGFADLATSDPTRPYCKPEILGADDGSIELKVWLVGWLVGWDGGRVRVLVASELVIDRYILGSAMLARAHPCCDPTPAAARTCVQGSRHPCVEVQEGVSFVANDCVMTRGTSWFNIITGWVSSGLRASALCVACVFLLCVACVLCAWCVCASGKPQAALFLAV
jgi:hypothetical protein